MSNHRNEIFIKFYLGLGPDSEGRMLRDIWSWDFEQLENVHDYIQWLFPLNEPSQFNFSAPILDPDSIELFKMEPRLQSNLKISVNVISNFYGFELVQDIDLFKIIKAANFQERKRNWLTAGNHNFLRLTRILKCLMLLELKEYALALYDALEDLYINEAANVIGRRTFHYWQTAVRD
jgi:hypothetical protein